MHRGETLAVDDVVAAVGVDLVNVPRLKRTVEHWGADLLQRVYTTAERTAASGAGGLRYESLAGFFAAKEAVKKVLASRGHVVGWTEVEVVNGSWGEPYLELHGRARAAAERCGIAELLLSIAHDGDFAVAIVVASLPGTEHTEEAS
jgi:holo-[acyl-carrier protein] synthase